MSGLFDCSMLSTMYSNTDLSWQQINQLIKSYACNNHETKKLTANFNLSLQRKKKRKGKKKEEGAGGLRRSMCRTEWGGKARHGKRGQEILITLEFLLWVMGPLSKSWWFRVSGVF